MKTVAVEFGGKMTGTIRQVSVDQILGGFCDRCGKNTTLARYCREQPEPVHYVALCERCLLAMLKRLIEEDWPGGKGAAHG